MKKWFDLTKEEQEKLNELFKDMIPIIGFWTADVQVLINCFFDFLEVMSSKSHKVSTS